MPGFRAPLQLVDTGSGDRRRVLPDEPAVAPGVDHGACASGAAETARPFVIRAAREADLAGEALAAHKLRSAVLLIEEAQEELTRGRAA